MKKEQYDRWRDFALRMAGVIVPSKQRKPTRKWVRDRVADFLDRFEEDHAWIVGWDKYSGDNLAITDQLKEYEWTWLPQDVRDLADEDDDEGAYEDARRRWFGDVKCCIRAGLDVASSPSGGVVGYTVGTLRRMYPDGVPAWVTSFFVSRRGGAMTPRGFARLPDDRGVWL